MSEVTDCTQSADSASRKRCPPSLDQDEDSTVPVKSTKVSDEPGEAGVASESCKSGETTGSKKDSKEVKTGGKGKAAVQTDPSSDGAGNTGSRHANKSTVGGHKKTNTKEPRSSHAHVPPDDATEAPEKTRRAEEVLNPALQSDSAAIAAAEALASLTGGDGEGSQETPCSSEKAKVKQGSKYRHRGSHQQSSKVGTITQAAAADSSTSLHSTDREDAEDVAEGGEEGEESMSAISSTPSSSFPSDNEDNDDGECAIVSVKMAPEMRQSVALLAQVQMRLESLEKKSARLHQRLDVKINRQRRPHLDQRSSITKTIPGFWVTALLNHPHLSAHIDETDEDALSYMTDLEVESFKNNKVGYRIRFHFRRNPYFQNNIIMKELHLGMGAPMSFSNPILWHRGQNLTANSEARKSSRGVYQTFFNWFSDHSNPGQDEVAQILKDDLYRDPLRYYLTPLWEPQENGSGSEGKAAGNGNGDECVVISDSDDDEGEEGEEAEQSQSRDQEDEEEEEEEEEKEEEEEDRGASGDESPEEEDEGGEIVIDGSDDSDQEEEEEEDEA